MLKMIVSLGLLMPLVGCQSDRLIPTTKPGSEPLVCSQWQPIYYDHLKDRARTVDQVKRNNAARNAYCQN